MSEDVDSFKHIRPRRHMHRRTPDEVSFVGWLLSEREDPAPPYGSMAWARDEAAAELLEIRAQSIREAHGVVRIVGCARCLANPGEKCRWSGRRRVNCHPERIRLWIDVRATELREELSQDLRQERLIPVADTHI